MNNRRAHLLIASAALAFAASVQTLQQARDEVPSEQRKATRHTRTKMQKKAARKARTAARLQDK